MQCVSESIYIEAGLEIELANSYVILDLDVSCISVENLSSVHTNMTGKDQAQLICLM